MENKILVSIVCNTYNHQDYIEQTLNSFIEQQVNFQYEILIYDDASTDNTSEIIRLFEKKYPNIIKPIYEDENQYSKGVRVDIINEARAIGKYIALCEGDDYWTDCNKLQKQVDFLEKNPDYTLCVHGATMINGLTNIVISNITPSNISREFSIQEVIYGGGDLFATNSMVYRRAESIHKPNFYCNAPIGDYPLVIFLSLIGRVYYLDDVMSAYRYAVPGSWTVRESIKIEKRIILYDKLETMLQEIDEYTDHAYSSIIDKTITRNRFDLLLAQGNFKEVRKGKYQGYYNLLSNKQKLVMYLTKYLPGLLPHLIKVKRCLLNVIKSY